MIRKHLLMKGDYVSCYLNYLLPSPKVAKNMVEEFKEEPFYQTI
jgi:hypothetical protein